MKIFKEEKKNKIRDGHTRRQISSLSLFCQKKSYLIVPVFSYLKDSIFLNIINLHEIFKEVTVATKHLKILKMPAKVVFTIPSLPLGLFCQLLIAIFLDF